MTDSSECSYTHRYAIALAYDGTKYAGWQRQPNAPTVAAVVEAAIAKITGSPVKLTGAGRTDAGVHARQQIAHWDAEKPIKTPFLHRLNSVLPSDVRATALYQADSLFHARHSALRRTYRYFIHWVPDPFCRAYSLFLPAHPNLQILNQAADLLLGSHNFIGFTKEPANQPNLICQVYQAHWIDLQSGKAFFEITANRFLRAMVRALVGAQLRVSAGKLSWDTFKAALYKGDRGWGMHLAQPQGLFLWSVEYPPQSLYLLEGYAIFTIESSSAPGSASEPASDTACPSAGGSDGGTG
ncbi:MAG: tRNA pseudouridine(38-40) synthase TruA [Bacteroidia bacterium]|nr:tRNA pseudouridine(38-40) synthase TruA [Bacteroidia bacterium]MCX7652909.1 tRNA pseudouridine(38-40) synthase TruA [Bacteroidia bacterium]MDW8416623.1 tRNA pseudouridine(38-40) synthase TruA [Bacteroidia bacterium]